MKKLTAIILFAVMFSFGVFARAYAIKCTKCLEYKYGDIDYMCRDWGTPTKKENGHIYGLYKCRYGHKVWVDLDGNTKEKTE